MRRWAIGLCLAFFLLYAAVFPGSTVTLALDQVPAWGEWMGNALLLVQGAAMACWLLAYYGWRGALTVLAVGVLAFVVEWLGERTGLLFGRYSYTEVLQPQVFGSVPLAICCAWVTVVPAAFVLVQRLGLRYPLIAVATLVLLLDLQIESVAVWMNNYWVWETGGPYYGVPTQNFVGWWVVGLLMAWIIQQLLPATPVPPVLAGRWGRLAHLVPVLLYAMSTALFAAANLLRGYEVAGVLGVLVLGVLAWLFTGRARPGAPLAATHRSGS